MSSMKSGRAATQITSNNTGLVSNDLGQAIKNLGRKARATAVNQSLDSVQLTQPEMFQPQIVDSAIGNSDFNSQITLK